MVDNQYIAGIQLSLTTTGMNPKTEEVAMEKRPRDAERTKTAILDAARRLFAERGIKTVSIRDIAAAAGVSHGLIQQYFGTRESMVAGIIKREIDAVMSIPPPIPDGTDDVDLEYPRRMLRDGMKSFRDFALIIMRAELAGIEPEKMLDPALPTPAMHLASAIAGRRAKRPPHDLPAMDPRLVSAYINAALFGFGAMAPWLMTSVGLQPEEYEQRIDELVTITVNLIALASGESEKIKKEVAGC